VAETNKIKRINNYLQNTTQKT